MHLQVPQVSEGCSPHGWTYSHLPRSGEPVRRCDQCGRAEVYYLDDLAEEMEAGDE
jgi:hypothetical protein